MKFKSKSSYLLIVLLGLLSLTFIIPTIQAIPSNLYTTRLIAGQYMEIGYVNTWSQVVDSSIILHVEYVITDPSWYIIDAHLAVATYLSDIPKTKTGNPIPGLFPYQASGIWSQYYEFTVNLTELFELYCPVETTLYIAAHAVVARVDDYGVVVRTETAWGQGSRFTNRGNWGMYYTYTVNCETSCEEVCTLDGNSSTAWARGYDLGGNSWATYNVYTGGNQTTDLMWRQYTYVGDIYIFGRVEVR